MKPHTLSMFLALFAGSTAQAGFIQVNGLITGGQMTEFQGATGATASVFGPGPMILMITSGNRGAGLTGGAGSLDVAEELIAGGTESGLTGTGSGSYNMPGPGFGCGASTGTICSVFMTTHYTLIVPTFNDAQLGTHQFLTAPFTAFAEFSGCDPNGINCFDGAFRGAGAVTADLFVFAPNQFAYAGADYEFAAIPEPLPIALVGLGLLAAALLSRNRLTK